MASNKSKAASAAEEFARGLRNDWNVYVAQVPIDIGGARAFNVGDAVPASHVTRGVVSTDDVVQRTDESALASLDAIQALPVATSANLPGADVHDGEEAAAENDVKGSDK